MLWKQARSIWDEFDRLPDFEMYVPADYQKVLDSLRRLQGKCATFLEWGSGLGVVTIMASRMGFEAYGLEVSSDLIRHSRLLAGQFAPGAKFVQGSFIPDAYPWNPKLDEDGCRTDFESSDGYGEMDMRLDDFDLIYAYPWPHEHTLFRDIVRKHGRPGAIFLTFDIREGMQLHRIRPQK